MNLKQVAKISKALGDSNRLKIIKAIQSQNGRLECTAISSFLSLAQPSISHHVKKLVDADLIEPHKEGRFYYYSLNQEVLDAYTKTLLNA